MLGEKNHEVGCRSLYLCIVTVATFPKIKCLMSLNEGAKWIKHYYHMTTL